MQARRDHAQSRSPHGPTHCGVSGFQGRAAWLGCQQRAAFGYARDLRVYGVSLDTGPAGSDVCVRAGESSGRRRGEIGGEAGSVESSEYGNLGSGSAGARGREGERGRERGDALVRGASGPKTKKGTIKGRFAPLLAVFFEVLGKHSMATDKS